MQTKLLLIACAALLGCSKTGSENPASANPVGQANASKSACDLKLVTSEDVAELLKEPVVNTKSIPGDSQSCELSSAGYTGVTISLRPGHGLATLSSYSAGKINDYDKSEPLTGVGDEAVRSLDLNRIIARKGDLLCEITGPGLSRPAGDPSIGSLSKICNKIFSSYDAH
jgi:hypothetical protein